MSPQERRLMTALSFTIPQDAVGHCARHGAGFSVRLDDSNSPIPARKLSEAGEVVIVARLSISGESMPKRGDMQGRVSP